MENDVTSVAANPNPWKVPQLPLSACSVTCATDQRQKNEAATRSGKNELRRDLVTGGGRP